MNSKIHGLLLQHTCAICIHLKKKKKKKQQRTIVCMYVKKNTNKNNLNKNVNIYRTANISENIRLEYLQSISLPFAVVISSPASDAAIFSLLTC